MSTKVVKSKFFVEQEEVETVAEVSTEQIEQWPENEKLKVIGKPVTRIDAYDKVSGSANYTFDIDLPRMCHAKILRSPFPHARIKSINTTEAENLDGVVHIVHNKNTPEIQWYYGTSVLFDPEVRYQGDEIACVVAESERIAEKALGLIEVDYEHLPFVTAATKAMQPDSPKVHNWGNITGENPELYERGDVEKGFQQADEIVEEKFETQVVVHNPAEPHCSVANWDGDKLILWDSTQGIFAVRDAVANSLGISNSNVRVIKKYMGGGFGSKLEASKHSVIAALLAKEIGRPVKITLDRKEQNLAVGNRPDSFQSLKLGAKKDGTLTAIKHTSYGAVGAYPGSASCGWPAVTMYKCANVHSEERSVLTNTGRSRPLRAPGHVQGFFALESIMDDLSEKIGMDPLEFRLKNDVDYDQVFSAPYTSKRLKEAYQKGAELIGWEKRNKEAGSGKGQVKKGIGMASQIWWGGGGPPAYATLKLNRDGSVNVLAGTQDLGTGTYTFIAQVAAEVLQIPIESVEVTIGDTEACPYCNVSGGSLTAPSVSPAVRDAAEKMKSKLISGASAILEVPEDQLQYSQAELASKSDSSKKLSIGDVVGQMRETVLITTGSRNANPEGYARNSFGAQFAEVEVDTLTGKVNVLKIVAAHDIGRTLNQKTLENQFHGGIIQGLGYALFEERLVDENTGKVLTTNLHAYKIPTMMDTPEIKIAIVSDYDPLISSTGVKGCGEPPIIPTAGAIANAVYNAIGVRIKSLPITPDKILNALYS
ncbi:MAG: xanthine dehydrogenase family protein molybdopterin-binding subunit [Ignavibacteria bacterium]|jgi:xanthine dehydrogenase YagR molybdenum-binding subunit